MKQAPTPSSARPQVSAAKPQQVSWSGGEKPSETFTAAYVPADRWNGWAKPYFSQDECQRVSATQSDFDDSIRFEYDSDRQVWQEVNEEEDYRSDCGTMLINGAACHQIGSGFTWMEVPEDGEQDADETPMRRLSASRVKRPGNTSPGGKGDPVPAPAGCLMLMLMSQQFLGPETLRPGLKRHAWARRLRRTTNGHLFRWVEYRP